MRKKGISILLMSLTLAWLGLGAITGCKQSGGGGESVNSNNESPSQPNYTGTWSGTSDQGKALTFTVQEVASYDITQLTYFIHTSGTACSADLQGTISNLLIPVNNKECVISGSGDNFTVEFHLYFDSATECHGTWTAVDNACGANNSGTFTSSKQENPLPVCTDADNDGYFSQADCGTTIDCDDNNQAINPGVAEVCGDGIDNNCNGQTDEGCEVPPPPAATLNVPADYSTIQAAIDAAKDGETVLVADGTYTENIDFKGKAITVKSQNGATYTIIDANTNGSAATFISNEKTDSILDGFTLKNGSGTVPDGESSSEGGGIYCDNSSPTILNCTISNNTATFGGGGIFCKNTSITFTNCIISNNTAGRAGGGIYCYDNSSAKFYGCTIKQNSAGRSGGGFYVAGIVCKPSIVNCIISQNTANDGNGGGICASSTDAKPIISKTIIDSNVAYSNGGGIFIFSSSVITNCFIANNSAQYGGGICSGEAKAPYVVNCTISNNVATRGSGIYCYAYSFLPTTLTVINSVLWENTINGNVGEIYLEKIQRTPPQGISDGDGPSINISYSNIQGGWSGTGNFAADPLFVGNGDYHLTAGSPCIDAGTSSSAPADDIDGETRPKGAGYDIGADEF